MSSEVKCPKCGCDDVAGDCGDVKVTFVPEVTAADIARKRLDKMDDRLMDAWVAYDKLREAAEAGKKLPKVPKMRDGWGTPFPRLKPTAEHLRVDCGNCGATSEVQPLDKKSGCTTTGSLTFIPSNTTTTFYGTGTAS